MYHQISPYEPLYNLGFGDIDIKTGEVNDLSVSNNQDTAKILATVAKSLIDFMSFHPNATVTAKGSTKSRTRLYQMSIAQFYEEINAILNVQGYYKDNWQPFEKGINFDAFLVSYKKFK